MSSGTRNPGITMGVVDHLECCVLNFNQDWLSKYERTHPKLIGGRKSCPIIEGLPKSNEFLLVNEKESNEKYSICQKY